VERCLSWARSEDLQRAHLVIGTALLFLVVFVLFPLVLLVLRSFLGTEGEISLQNYIAVYGKESNWDAVVTTLLVCVSPCSSP